MAQNYRCVNPSVKKYYTNNLHYLRGIRIDSVKTIGTDTVLYPFRSYRGAYIQFATLDSNGASWMGKTIIIRPDGMTLFTTQWGDTVFINTLANNGDSWRFYDDTSQYYYTATITNIHSVSGSNDSIKTITINSYNNAGINTADVLNGLQLLLSKDDGLIQSTDLGLFPMQHNGKGLKYETDYLLFETVYDKYGLGIDFSKPNLQFKQIQYQQPDNLEYYNYNTGDMFMYESMMDNNYRYTTYTVHEILAKHQPSVDEVIYTVKISSKYPTGNTSSGIQDITYTRDYYNDTAYMPEEWRNPVFMYFNPNDSSYCTKGLYRYKTTRVDYQHADIRFFEPSETDASFKKGIGRTYLYDQMGSGHTFYTNKMTRVYKGVPCGPIPYINIGVDKLALDNVVIYPSPANDILYINTVNNITGSIVIIDNFGKVLKNIQVNSSVTKIDISTVPSGIYTMQLITNDNTYMYKISIAH